jgi:hypothetical protein
MTTKERLHELVDELSEFEADDALRVLIERRRDGASTEETAWMPDSWRTFADGTPQPDWTVLIRADRDNGH